jgi:hypothetical protein
MVSFHVIDTALIIEHSVFRTVSPARGWGLGAVEQVLPFHLYTSRVVRSLFEISRATSVHWATLMTRTIRPFC